MKVGSESMLKNEFMQGEDTEIENKVELDDEKEEKKRYRRSF